MSGKPLMDYTLAEVKEIFQKGDCKACLFYKDKTSGSHCPFCGVNPCQLQFIGITKEEAETDGWQKEDRSFLPKRKREHYSTGSPKPMHGDKAERNYFPTSQRGLAYYRRLGGQREWHPLDEVFHG